MGRRGRRPDRALLDLRCWDHRSKRLVVLWVTVDAPGVLRGRLPGGRDLPGDVETVEVACPIPTCSRSARVSLAFVAEWLADRFEVYKGRSPAPFVHHIRPEDRDAWYRSDQVAARSQCGGRIAEHRPELSAGVEAHLLPEAR